MKLFFSSRISKFNVLMTISALGVTTFSLPGTAVPQEVCVRTSPGNVVCGEPVPKSSSNPGQTDRYATPVTQPGTSQSLQILTCGASTAERTYVVDQLNPDANSFDMAIYKQRREYKDYYENYGDYVGTVQVNIIQREFGLVGRGQFGNSPIEVTALGRGNAFTVQDSSGRGPYGRCNTFWEMANNETRRLVRECLALAARQGRGVAEVQRFACTGNPRSYIQELQRQK